MIVVIPDGWSSYGCGQWVDSPVTGNFEQYVIRANIEAEESFSIAQTMILPAGLRQLALISEAGVSALEGEVRELVDELVASLGELKSANSYPDGLEGLDLAVYARDNQLEAMAKVCEAADKLEKIVPDDLFNTIRGLLAGGTPGEPKTRVSTHPYELRGVLFCAHCGRRTDATKLSAASSCRWAGGVSLGSQCRPRQ